MPLTYILLFLTVTTLWLPKRIGPTPWHLMLVLAVGTGLVQSYITWMALGPILLLTLGVFLMPRHRGLGALLLIPTSIGLGAHLFPGFNNLRVLDQVLISRDAIPFTLYLNFDKTLIGIFILGSLLPLTRGFADWRRVIKRVGTHGVCITIGIAGVSLLLGFVRIDPKIPESLWLWSATNLLLVCVAEEAFFRGFIQVQLTRIGAHWRCGNFLAIGMAAVFFGIAHFGGGIKYVALATLAGAGYGWMYSQTKRIEASILTHFTLNLFHIFVLTYPALAPT